MAKREEKGSAGSFSRGAELWMHQARLFVVAIWTVVLISILAGLAVTTAYFWNATTADEKYALERNVLAHTRDALYMTAGKMELNVNGELRKMEVSEVALLTDDMAEDAWRKLRNGGMFGLLTSIGVVFLISLYWWGYGRERMQDNQLRGAKLVEGKELARLIRHRDEASPYEIAGVPMRVKSETLHTLFAGAQGTGKSQQFFALMKQVRARGKRMIVYDPTGEFTQAFYREGKDILMNPLDSRSPNWNIWNEIAKDYHFDNMANGLIPDPAESDPFWALAGRMVLKDVIAVLGREGRRTNRDLYNAIAKSNLDAMHALLQGTAGATYVDPTTERTGMSLKMTVQNQLEAFRFLPDEGESFSIRKWVHEEGDSWMFITAREAMREALKPVLSLWIDTAIKAVLDLEPIHRERLWFCIDELPTLQKLDILKLALTNTRKYGLCMVLGVQDFSQLYEIYGHDLAKTIISGCQTKLLLRVTDGAAAKLLAELMGQAEVDEKDETLSYGLSSQRDGVSVMARRQMRDLVLTSEILTLPDMTGYLLVPGDYPIARVKYGYVPTEKQANGFIERDGFAISFKPTTAAAAPAPAPAAAEVQQPSVPEQGDMLDDDDMDAPATVEVMRNE
ncbi:MAG: type VI secretion protein, partial [Gammaproteobacteria bacterium]